METWFWVALMVTAILGLYWFARQQGGPPNRYLAMLIPHVADERLFVPQGGLTQQQARQRYQESYRALQKKDYETALSGFTELESVYPGLLDLIYLHEAQASAQQGNEWAVQQKLDELARQKPDSPLRAMAHYELGLSHVRANEPKKAREAFDRIRQKYPDTQYATGSLYYLGLLAQKTDPQTTRQHWLAYLTECPDCRFSGEIAESLETLLPQPGPTEHLLMGMGLASNQRSWDKALVHLKQTPFSQAWLWLAKAQLEKGQKPAAVQSLMQGIPHAKNAEEAQEAVDQIIKHSTAGEKAVLTTLNAKTLPYGHDYVLWRLGQLDGAGGYAQQLISQYPTSDYAPESSWQVMWNELKEGRRDAFLQRAQTHLDNYPFSRSAPRVLFWLGKTLEKTNIAESRTAYRKLQKTYPSDYYAFRAAGRLAALSNQSDLGWRTTANRNYPPNTPASLQTLDIFPENLPMGLRQDVLHELQQMGMADDVVLLMTEALPSGEKIPATVRSWAHQVQGDRAKGLKVMREAFEARQKAAFQEKAFAGAIPTETELRLLYPVYFGNEIAQQASRQSMDPFLIQALMREESYFNEFAVSSSDARGLMQLLPSTAHEVAGWEHLSGFQTLDLFRPDVNVRLGSRYLGHLHQLFGGQSMPSVGAYNGGPNAMKRWISASTSYTSDPDLFVENIPYGQSRDYIKKVFGSFWNYTRLYGAR